MQVEKEKRGDLGVLAIAVRVDKGRGNHENTLE
jgi:hypothetical protein